MDLSTNTDNPEEHGCFICEKLGSNSRLNSDSDELVKVTRGLSTLRSASAEREDGLLQFFNASEFVYVHQKCRKNYIHKTYIKLYKNQNKAASSSIFSRSDFNWNDNCFICGKEANHMKEKKVSKNRRRKIHYVINARLGETILSLAKHLKDDQSIEVHKRVSSVADLVTARAKYHADCYSNFRKKLERKGQATKMNDLKEDPEMDQIFKFLEENHYCLFSLKELKNILTSKTTPNIKSIESKLLSRYGDDLIVSSQHGCETLVCFKKKHHEILEENWSKAKLAYDANEENRILKAAAKILRRDIQSQVGSNNIRPVGDKIEDVQTTIPESLKLILSEIILKGGDNGNAGFYETKCLSAARDIISAVVSPNLQTDEVENK